MVRLKDIAEAANVSVSLASKVLNDVRGNSAASPRTSALIRQTAKRLGYVRNRSAASLSSGRQNAIGLVMLPAGAPGSEIVQNFLIGLTTEANKHNQRLEMEFFSSEQMLQAALARMSPSVVDGLIVYGFRESYLPRAIGAFDGKPLPLVGVFEKIFDPEIPAILNDGITSMRLATEHLIEQGCRKIAHIGVWDKRAEAYRQTLERFGLPFDRSLVYLNETVAFHTQVGKDGVANLMFREADFDGIVCQCDIFALGALQALLAKGIRVPEKVKVVGSDNSPICEMAPVPLSSVHIDSVETARLAVTQLMQWINGKKPGSLSVLPHLVARASTAR